MKKYFACIVAIVAVLGVVSLASAGTISTLPYTSSTTSLTQMTDVTAHSYYWDTGANLAPNSSVTATLTITGLYAAAAGDVLNIKVLNSVPSGYSWSAMSGSTTAFSTTTADVFKSGAAYALTNLPTSQANAITETLTITNYIPSAGGEIYIGFSPDCTFYDTKVSINIASTSTPEPGTLLLLCLGLAGCALFEIKRRIA